MANWIKKLHEQYKVFSTSQYQYSLNYVHYVQRTALTVSHNNAGKQHSFTSQTDQQQQ